VTWRRGCARRVVGGDGADEETPAGHDRGEVLVDLAVAIADGATTISNLRVLANQAALVGSVASTATASRTLARPAAAWEAGMDPGFRVIDIDATLVNSHSDKEGAAPAYKHGYGFYPLTAYLDATGEALAAL
jgi:hypothetical protein